MRKKVTLAINGVMNKVYLSQMLGMGTSIQSLPSKYIHERNESKYARNVCTPTVTEMRNKFYSGIATHLTKLRNTNLFDRLGNKCPTSANL